MVLIPPAYSLHDPILTVFFDRLQHLFTAMDQQYAEAARHYGFHCAGCEDNCCRTRFYHHTYLEYLYIHKGLKKLDHHRQGQIQSKAAEVCRETAEADEKSASVRLMCPLNHDGLCSLYDYRPMICRLHGISHELKKPGQRPTKGPGCGLFDHLSSGKSYYKFDRTPFYLKMAQLESELKQAAGFKPRIKMTIAEMIAAMSMAHGAEGIGHGG